jgi:putative transposase
MPEDRKEQVALFRYSVISEAVSDRLSHPERGLVVRALATKPWVTPEGDERFISRTTIDRWVGAYRRDGLSGLEPEPRSDKGHGRANPELMAEAVRLRRQVPARSAAQIAEIIARAHGVRLAERTLREHLARSGVSRAAISADPAKAFGRYEASRRNEIWIGDVLIGPFVPQPRKPGSKRAKLFVLVDDYSRLLVGARWMEEENTRAGQEVLRAAVCRRGVPEICYFDNGAPYRSHQLERTCAVLGIHLVHSKPYQPAGRGKQERLNRYIRERFLTEAEAAGIKSFEQLNDDFSAWAEQVANTRVHSETKAAPIARFLTAGPPQLPDAQVVREAFRWSVMRRVTKTATVSLYANRYEVDPGLVGRNVELRFDPEDLSVIDVVTNGVTICQAAPFKIGRHVHPSVKKEEPRSIGEQDGPLIDYLGLVRIADDEAKGSGRIDFREIKLPGFEETGTEQSETM